MSSKIIIITKARLKAVEALIPDNLTYCPRCDDYADNAHWSGDPEDFLCDDCHRNDEPEDPRTWSEIYAEEAPR